MTHSVTMKFKCRIMYQNKFGNYCVCWFHCKDDDDVNDDIITSKLAFRRRSVCRDELFDTFWGSESGNVVRSATLPLSEPQPTTTTGHYTTCCKSQSHAPEDGKKIARDMLSWSWRSINCYCCIWLVFLYYFTNIDGGRSNTNHVDGRDMEGNVHAVIIPAFTWMNSGKPRKDISLACLWTEVRYRYLLNMKQVCHPLDR